MGKVPTTDVHTFPKGIDWKVNVIAWLEFNLVSVVLILLYGCTTWTLTKRMEKKIDGNYTRMLQAILNKNWRQHPTKQQLYGHLPPITKTIKVRRTRRVGHCWRSRDNLTSDVLLRTPSHGRAKAGRPARTYIQQICVDIGGCPEDLPEAMNDREGQGYPCWWLDMMMMMTTMHQKISWKYIGKLPSECLSSEYNMQVFVYRGWKYIGNGCDYVKKSTICVIYRNKNRIGGPSSIPR